MRAGYTRLPFAASADVQSLPRITGIGGNLGETIRIGAVYDKITAGLPLVRWLWAPPLAELPGDFPPLDISVTFALPIAHAINATAMRPDEVSGIEITKGAIVGRVNGQPIITVSRLIIVGGLLLPRASFIKRSTPTPASA